LRGEFRHETSSHALSFTAKDRHTDSEAQYGKGDWKRAHESAQQDEGPEGSWVHAYLTTILLEILQDTVTPK
jgi:hypothetical protein